ncbi:hypothetical protein GCM10011414_29590 [Croceivirga lutea]|uniref:FKBP-type peptidyl-prolyl cis-trans isomerase n=1 Tax=Croceivirga lutea TaxID=1775167 RepID=UPI00163A8CFE|nr:hypothetical protein [Croceivirga lutea]GGG57876.1 hypothetical protein GCM10011414_29590 [Croceivirga lutea]
MIKRLLLFVTTIALLGCNNDDDNDDAVPPRLLSEVAEENDEEILAFLGSHTFNYEEFEQTPAGFDFKIVIDTITEANADKMSFMDFLTMDSLKVETVNVSSNEFLLSEEENDVPHKYYYMVLREGVGATPSVADSVYVRYRGQLLNRTSFDGTDFTPTWFDLVTLQQPQSSFGGKSFRGFGLGASKIASGGEVINNNDGTFSVDGYGIGLVIFPSGLGNFNNVSGAIPQYSPLIFTYDMFAMNVADHDQDGVPSIEEDLNGNGYLFDDNTDLTSEENSGSTFRFPDYVDIDDDDDGVLTKTEISDANCDIVLPYPDTNNDGTPDYLDADVQKEDCDDDTDD